MDSPKKASIKHLEFKLQREKTLTKDLDARCKIFQAQIAQLEQDKAELRRDKLSLADEAKKVPKLDERIHVLLKEIEAKDTLVSQMRANVTAAKAEIDSIRHNANTSIASWKKAEEQWIAEQSALNKHIEAQRDEISNLKSTLNDKQFELGRVLENLGKETERVEKVKGVQEKLEKELRITNEKLESSQNKNFALEQTLYQLNLDCNRVKEELDCKDTEIKTLKAHVAKHQETEEGMEKTISSLNDRINSARMINLETKTENEKLLCDITDARKESQRLEMQIDALKRDLELGSQSQAMLQRSLNDLQKKYDMEREKLKEKNLEVQKHELAISQLVVKIKKTDSAFAEQSVQYSSMKTELLKLKEECNRLKNSANTYLQDNNDLKQRIEELKATLDLKDEELVLSYSHLKDQIEKLTSDLKNAENQVAERQDIIKDLTHQLSLTNEKNTMCFNKLLQDSESSAKMQKKNAALFEELQTSVQEIFKLTCVVEKDQQLMDYFSDTINLLYLERSSLISLLQLSQADIQSQQEKNEQLEKTIAASENLHRQLQDHTRAQKTEVQTLQAQLTEYANLDLAHQQEIVSLREHVADIETILDERKKEIERLSADMLCCQVERQSQEKEWALQQMRLKETICNILSRETMIASMLDYNLFFLDESVMKKANHFEQAVTLVLENAHYQLKEEADAKRKVLLRCKEMYTFIEQIKSSNNNSVIVATERQNILQQKIETLTNELQIAKMEAKHADSRLDVVLGRFKNEQQSINAFKKETKGALDDLQARLEEAKKENQKLRKGLEYEITRKCEYKGALEKLKRLREEIEGCREKEKHVATEAIKAANQEARYWMQCFEQLKNTIQAGERGATHIPSVEPATSNPLESPKSRIYGTLESKSINCSTPSEITPKRQRK